MHFLFRIASWPLGRRLSGLLLYGSFKLLEVSELCRDLRAGKGESENNRIE